MPATKIGKPNFAYSKKANFKPVCDNTPCTTKLFGEPISERLPPSVDANAIGINKRERTKPDLEEIPRITGMRMAAVPVLDNTPDIKPVMIISTTINWRSLLAKRLTTPPILFAIPVSNKAPPITNIATNKITLVSTKPKNASFAGNTPVTAKPTVTTIAVTASGSFSSANIKTAKPRKQSVITLGVMDKLL